MDHLDSFEGNITINWTSFDADFLDRDLNFTFDPELFDRNVKQISEPYFSIIIAFYILVISISGKYQRVHENILVI